MVWLYVVVALVAAATAFLLARMVSDSSAKQLIGAWVCLLTGAYFFLIYALEGEHSRFALSIGVTCFVTGVLALLRASRRSTGAVES
jgi:hypothetical protein